MVLGWQHQAANALILGSTVRFNSSAQGQAIRKLFTHVSGQSALNPILYPEIIPDIITAMVNEDSRAVNQNCFLLIICLLRLSF